MDEFKIKAIIIHPEAEALTAEIERLRTELSMLVLERDHLLFHECKQIEMDYMLTIGALEYRAYKLECDVRRLKRKMELTQAQRNRREGIDLRTIEGILDAEFIEYLTKLSEQLDKLTSAMKRHQSGVLSESETTKLRKLYRQLMKELHPDLHPDQPEDHRTFFLLAQDAYEKADLQSLDTIHVIVVGALKAVITTDAIDSLRAEKERLRRAVSKLRQNVDDIKSSHPYVLRQYLDSPEKAAARTREIEARIASLSDGQAVYARRIASLLGNHHG